MAQKITVDQAKCTGCMRCLDLCYLGNFEANDGKVRGAEGMYCFSCGHCVAVCPTDAISHADFDASAFEPLDESARPSYDQLLKFLKMRRSRREFKDQPVPRDVIDKLLLAAVEAPSAINNQSVQYTAVTDRDVLKQISERSARALENMKKMMTNPIGRLIFRAMMRDGYEDMMEFLPLVDCLLGFQKAGRDMMLYDAPCMILLHAPKSDMMAPGDAIFNAENILLAAETLGLGACVIGFVTEPANRDPEIKRLVQMPKDHKVFCAIALGYPKFKYTHAAPKNPPMIHFV